MRCSLPTFKKPATRWPFLAGGLAGLLVLLIAAAPCLAEDTLPKAADLIDKCIDALGGRAALQKLHNRVAKGTFEVPAQQIKGTVTSYEAERNKTYTRIEIPGIGLIENGCDGHVHWENNVMVGPRIIEGEEAALAERQSTFNGILYWPKLYKSAETTGVAEVDGKPCYKVVMTPSEGAPETWYFDKESHLQVREDIPIKGPMGQIVVQVYMEDYKPVDGVQLPHTVRQVAGGMEQIVKVESFEHNVDIPKDRFDLPAAIKELQAQPTTKP